MTHGIEQRLMLSNAGVIAARGAANIGRQSRGYPMDEKTITDLISIAEAFERYLALVTGGSGHDYFRNESSVDVLAQIAAGLPGDMATDAHNLRGLVVGESDAASSDLLHARLAAVADEINGRLSSSGETIVRGNIFG